MPTLPLNSYAPDPTREPDGTSAPGDQPASLRDSGNPEPPIESGDPGDVSSYSPIPNMSTINAGRRQC